MTRCARIFGLVLAALGSVTTAHSEPRYVPQPGAALLYRTVAYEPSEPGKPREPVGASVTLYKFDSSDGVTATGTAIQSEEVVASSRCNTEACRKVAQPVTIEGVPMMHLEIPPDLQEQTAPLSGFRRRLFLTELLNRPVLTPPRTPSADEPGCCEMPWVMESKLECDPAALKSFVPFGALDRLSLTCRRYLGITHAKTEFAPKSSDADTTVELTYLGPGTVTTHAGTFEVRNFRSMETGAEGGFRSFRSTTETAFSEELGAAVRTHIVAERLKDGEWRAMSETDIELLTAH